MQLTWAQARDTIIEFTEIGYTIASQDRLWTVFIFDEWSTDEFRHNRLFTRGIGETWSYDPWWDELFWTTRHEAEAFAEELREYMEDSNQTSDPTPEVFVMNWGDDARFEALTIGRYGVTPRTTPKFKGSERAWTAMQEQSRLWREREVSGPSGD